MGGYAGLFLLATPVAEHCVGTLVHVTVPARHETRLQLDFNEHDRVQADACVLLIGDVGALALQQLGYTGPLIRRPLMAAWHARQRSDDAAAAR